VAELFCVLLACIIERQQAGPSGGMLDVNLWR